VRSAPPDCRVEACARKVDSSSPAGDALAAVQARPTWLQSRITHLRPRLRLPSQNRFSTTSSNICSDALIQDFYAKEPTSSSGPVRAQLWPRGSRGCGTRRWAPPRSCRRHDQRRPWAACVGTRGSPCSLLEWSPSSCWAPCPSDPTPCPPNPLLAPKPQLLAPHPHAPTPPADPPGARHQPGGRPRRRARLRQPRAVAGRQVAGHRVCRAAVRSSDGRGGARRA
jgi:hypothetical protein